MATFGLCDGGSRVKIPGFRTLAVAFCYQTYPNCPRKVVEKTPESQAPPPFCSSLTVIPGKVWGPLCLSVLWKTMGWAGQPQLRLSNL